LVPISRRALNNHTIVVLPSAFRAVYRWIGRCFRQMLVYPGGRVMLPISHVHLNTDQAVRWLDRLSKSDALTSFFSRRAPDLRVGQVAEDTRASIAGSEGIPRTVLSIPSDPHRRVITLALRRPRPSAAAEVEMARREGCVASPLSDTVQYHCKCRQTRAGVMRVRRRRAWWTIL
jgi:hypothetical protein